MNIFKYPFMYTVISGLVTCLLLGSCNSAGGADTQYAEPLTDSIPFTEIRIDPTQPENLSKTITTSQVFDTVAYIPLETMQESIFGRIDKLEITDKYFVILDKTTNEIFVFTKEGKFYSKISNKKPSQAKTIYKKIFNMTVNRQTNEIIFFDGHTGIMFYYGLNGTYHKELKTTIDFLDFAHINGKWTAYIGTRNAFIEKDRRNTKFCNLVIANNDMKEMNRWQLPYDTTIDWRLQTYGPSKREFFRSDSIIYASQPYDYHIYNINTTGIVGGYHFIFPMNSSLPLDFFNNKKYKDKWIEFSEKNSNIIFMINTFFNTPGCIAFDFSNNNLDGPFLFNTTTKSLLSFKKIASDSCSYFLPVGTEFHGEHSGSLYSSESAAFLMKSFRQLPGSLKINLMPAELKSFLKEANNADNPVLIQLKLKHFF